MNDLPGKNPDLGDVLMNSRSRRTDRALGVDAPRDHEPIRRVTVLIPSYNHAAYVGEAIASVARQDHPETELYVVDDGSTDNSVGVIEAALNASGLRECRFEVQPNAGVSRTLNRMIHNVDSEYVAILSSDDVYAPNRLSRLLQEAPRGELFLGFSQGGFLSHSNPIEEADFLCTQAILLHRFCHVPTAGYALMARNLPISSSNFLFSRTLFDEVGGFHPELVIGEEWDFALQSTLHVEPVFVPESLWSYRLHPRNTWRSQQQGRAAALQLSFDRFVAAASGKVGNPLAPLPWHWPRFFRLYARLASRSFGDLPLATLMPGAWLAAQPASPAGAHGPVPASLEDRALEDLLRIMGWTRTERTTDLDELYVQCSRHWADMKARAHVRG